MLLQPSIDTRQVQGELLGRQLLYIIDNLIVFYLYNASSGGWNIREEWPLVQEMRHPGWNQGRRTCTLSVNPQDALALNLEDGEIVGVTTETGTAVVKVEITEKVRMGQVMIPHGFGLTYRGEVHGINVNRLTSTSHRDRMAATRLHRYVLCRIEKMADPPSQH